MVSVNTNAGAIVAVASLRRADVTFLGTSKKLESGFRVADAFDDASVFTVAQGVRANVKAAVAVQSSLAQGESVARVALSGLEQVSNLINEVRAKIIMLADGSATASARAALKSDAQSLMRQISEVQSAASFNGRSQLDASATTLSFVSDIEGRTITVGTYDGSANYTALNTAIGNITDVASALSALTQISPLEQGVQTAYASFGASVRQFESQRNFVEALVDASRKVLGVLVDTDVAEAAAMRESTLVQKSLSMAAIALANASTRRIVNILR